MAETGTILDDPGDAQGSAAAQLGAKRTTADFRTFLAKGFSRDANAARPTARPSSSDANQRRIRETGSELNAEAGSRR